MSTVPRRVVDPINDCSKPECRASGNCLFRVRLEKQFHVIWDGEGSLTDIATFQIRNRANAEEANCGNLKALDSAWDYVRDAMQARERERSG